MDEILPYKEFRTNLTFKDIFHILKRQSNELYLKGQYMFITRHTVLGRWKEIKEKMYSDYLDMIENEKIPDFVTKEY